MAQPRDELGDLETRKLAAFAGLGALRDLDLDLVARAEIFGGDAKAARSDLLDIAVGVVAIGIGAIAFARFAAFARHRLGADAVHRDRQRLMRLGRQCAERHPRGDETLEIGIASCRERVCQSVYIPVVAGLLKNKTEDTTQSKNR